MGGYVWMHGTIMILSRAGRSSCVGVQCPAGTYGIEGAHRHFHVWFYAIILFLAVRMHCGCLKNQGCVRVSQTFKFFFVNQIKCLLQEAGSRMSQPAIRASKDIIQAWQASICFVYCVVFRKKKFYRGCWTGCLGAELGLA